MGYFLEIESSNKKEISLIRIYDNIIKKSYFIKYNPLYKSCYFHHKLKDKINEDEKYNLPNFYIPIDNKKFNELLNMKINKLYKFKMIDLLIHLGLEEWII